MYPSMKEHYCQTVNKTKQTDGTDYKHDHTLDLPFFIYSFPIETRIGWFSKNLVAIPRLANIKSLVKASSLSILKLGHARNQKVCI